MAITIEDSQDIRVENVTGVRADFSTYSVDLIVETSYGTVTIVLDSRSKIEDLMRELFDEINVEYGFADEDDDEE